ncbi:MAG: glycosyltransferase [Bacteroidales bacterium]|nr:glycosyltransferase [Bacteroidales bacterium]
MRILVLTSTFPDRLESWNGIFVKEQVSAIAKEHDVCVVRLRVDYTRFKPFFSYKLIKDTTLGYPLYRITVAKSFPIYNQFNYIVAACYATIKVLSDFKPDLIHCHYSYPSGIVASLIKKFYKIPFITTEHTKIKTTFRSVFHRILSLFAMKRAFRVVAVSNTLKAELKAVGINNVEVIPNVINIERFKTNKQNTNPFVIGFLGSMNSHNKGLDILLKACLELPFEYFIRVGGAGKYLEYYRNLSRELGIENKCGFLGEILSPDIPSFYNDLSVFVLASKYETFGIVLVEAMASGIPVIATKCGGPVDIVNYTSGILVDTDNVDQFMNAIINIHTNYESYKSEEIKNYALNSFSSIPFMLKTNNLYRLCLSK